MTNQLWVKLEIHFDFPIMVLSCLVCTVLNEWWKKYLLKKGELFKYFPATKQITTGHVYFRLPSTMTANNAHKVLLNKEPEDYKSDYLPPRTIYQVHVLWYVRIYVISKCNYFCIDKYCVLVAVLTR